MSKDAPSSNPVLKALEAQFDSIDSAEALVIDPSKMTPELASEMAQKIGDLLKKKVTEGIYDADHSRAIDEAIADFMSALGALLFQLSTGEKTREDIGSLVVDMREQIKGVGDERARSRTSASTLANRLASGVLDSIEFKTPLSGPSVELTTDLSDFLPLNERREIVDRFKSSVFQSVLDSLGSERLPDNVRLDELTIFMASFFESVTLDQFFSLLSVEMTVGRSKEGVIAAIFEAQFNLFEESIRTIWRDFSRGQGPKNQANFDYGLEGVENALKAAAELGPAAYEFSPEALPGHFQEAYRRVLLLKDHLKKTDGVGFRLVEGLLRAFFVLDEADCDQSKRVFFLILMSALPLDEEGCLDEKQLDPSTILDRLFNALDNFTDVLQPTESLDVVTLPAEHLVVLMDAAGSARDSFNALQGNMNDQNVRPSDLESIEGQISVYRVDLVTIQAKLRTLHDQVERTEDFSRIRTLADEGLVLEKAKGELEKKIASLQEELDVVQHQMDRNAQMQADLASADGWIASIQAVLEALIE